jgi:hypothetical protein
MSKQIQNSLSMSDSLKKIFLIEFTKELIKNSKKTEIILSEKTKNSKKLSFPLKISEPVFPITFQYIKPNLPEKEIDLKRLNPLIKDPFVKAIECNGEDEAIIVEGNIGRKRTDIVLNKVEINEIIKKFSEEGKTPIHLGVYKIVVGKLRLLAIISELISTKFLIQKLF